MIVDLPLPDGPTIATVSPSSIVRSTPRAARGTRPCRCGRRSRRRASPIKRWTLRHRGGLAPDQDLRHAFTTPGSLPAVRTILFGRSDADIGADLAAVVRLSRKCPKPVPLLAAVRRTQRCSHASRRELAQPMANPPRRGRHGSRLNLSSMRPVERAMSRSGPSASRRSQHDFAPGVYRVGTLAESGRRFAVPPTAVQRLTAAMLDRFSLGTVRKGSAEPHRKGENRAVARFLRALCRTRTGDPFLTMEVPIRR